MVYMDILNLVQFCAQIWDLYAKFDEPQRESLPNRYSSQILHREGIAGELKRDGNFFGACVPEKGVYM